MKKKIIIYITICIIISIIYFIFQFSLAKYNYNLSIDAFNLTRNTYLPNAKVLYSTQEPTNKDVIISIKVDKEIMEVEGFNWDNENKVLTKTISENEENKIILKDYSGNKEEVSYKVDWIDKIKPEIIGIENGKTYSAPVGLSYKDNIGIKSIDVQNYGYLKVEFNELSYDTEKKYAFDYTDTTCTVKILQKPRGTYKFRYYCNNVLVEETADEIYTYKNLEKDNHSLKLTIDAIDINGNILERKIVNGSTSTYKEVKVSKNNLGATVNLKGIEDSAKYVRYYVWEKDKQSTTQRGYLVKITNGMASLPFKISEFNNKQGIYTIHIYTEDEKGNRSLANGIDIEIGKEYNPNLAEKEEIIKNPTNVNRLEQKGKYVITVIDLAGNETKYTIRVVN